MPANRSTISNADGHFSTIRRVVIAIPVCALNEPRTTCYINVTSNPDGSYAASLSAYNFQAFAAIAIA